MENETIKNDIKTMFLIVNTLNGMVAGLFPLSMSGGILATEGFIPPLLCTTGLALPILALTALGYYSTFTDSRKMLTAFCWLLGLVTVMEWIAVEMLFPEVNLIVFDIFHTGVTLASVTSAMALAKRASPKLDLSETPTKTACCWKCLGYCVAALAILYIPTYFL